MDAMPWDDGMFDAVTSFNGIWAGNSAALSEAARVVRPGGRVAVMFFAAARVDHLAPLIALMAMAPPAEASSGAGLLEIGRPGVAEAMMSEAGLELLSRGRTFGVSEWPDADIAWRATAATGPAWSVLQHLDEERAAAAVRDALAPFEVTGLGYRLVSEYDYVIGLKPSERHRW